MNKPLVNGTHVNSHEFTSASESVRMSPRLLIGQEEDILMGSLSVKVGEPLLANQRPWKFCLPQTEKLYMQVAPQHTNVMQKWDFVRKACRFLLPGWGSTVWWWCWLLMMTRNKTMNNFLLSQEEKSILDITTDSYLYPMTVTWWLITVIYHTSTVRTV